jgi:hypothetical protein
MKVVSAIVLSMCGGFAAVSSLPATGERFQNKVAHVSKAAAYVALNTVVPSAHAWGGNDNNNGGGWGNGNNGGGFSFGGGGGSCR